MDGPGQGQRHFLSKSQVFHNTQREVIWQKEFLKSMQRDKSGKMAIWQKKMPFWHFCPCVGQLEKLPVRSELLSQYFVEPVEKSTLFNFLEI